MLSLANLDLPHPILAAMLLGVSIGVFAYVVRAAPAATPTLPRRSRVLLRSGRLGCLAPLFFAIGTALFALAAGGLRLAVPGEDKVQVLVDLSPSTRGAFWHEPQALQPRIDQLLGKTPYTLVWFGEDGQTRFAPPGNGPVLLLSDGQFDLPPVAPRVFAVVDPALDAVDDARIVAIEQERGESIAVVENRGNQPRELVGTSTTVPHGRFRIRLGEGTQGYHVQLKPGDRWPENDHMVSLPEQPPNLSRWSAGVTMAGYEAISDLPLSAEPYSFTSVLVIDASLAAELSSEQQQAITAYVRELGGSLIIVGQDARWSELRGTTIETVCPLAVDPPKAASEWIVLLDASGSMVASNLWGQAVGAAAVAVRGLPQSDPLRVGSYAADVRWWDATTPREGINPPANLRPHGPTNLQAALEQVLTLPGGSPKHLLLLSDAEVELKDLTLSQRLAAAHVQTSCLALADGRGRAALEGLCRQTGGRMLLEADAGRWPTAARDLARSAAPPRWQQRSIRLGQETVDRWNLAWPKQDATVVAKDDTGETLAARWNVGLGQVAAVSWPAQQQTLERLLPGMTSLPTPNLQIRWEQGMVVVADPEMQKLVIRWTPAQEKEPAITLPLRPTAPGEYQAQLPATQGGAVATVLRDGQIVARHAVAPRCAPEFDHLGNNRANLAELCRRTGGRIVESDETGSLNIRGTERFVDLAWLAGLAGAVALAMATLELRKRI